MSNPAQGKAATACYSRDGTVFGELGLGREEDEMDGMDGQQGINQQQQQHSGTVHSPEGAKINEILPSK